MKNGIIGFFLVSAHILIIAMIGMALDAVGFIEVDDPITFAASCMVFGLMYERATARLDKKSGGRP